MSTIKRRGFKISIILCEMIFFISLVLQIFAPALLGICLIGNLETIKFVAAINEIPATVRTEVTSVSTTIESSTTLKTLENSSTLTTVQFESNETAPSTVSISIPSLSKIPNTRKPSSRTQPTPSTSTVSDQQQHQRKFYPDPESDDIRSFQRYESYNDFGKIPYDTIHQILRDEETTVSPGTANVAGGRKAKRRHHLTNKRSIKNSKRKFLRVERKKRNSMKIAKHQIEKRSIFSGRTIPRKEEIFVNSNSDKDNNNNNNDSDNEDNENYLVIHDKNQDKHNKSSSTIYLDLTFKNLISFPSISNNKTIINENSLFHSLFSNFSNGNNKTDDKNSTKSEIQSYLNNIKILNLSNNHLSKIELKSFENFKNLHELDLSKNKINSFLINSEKVKTLKVINLSSNNIENFTVSATATNLKEIYLKSNNIKSLKGFTNFSKLNNLELIDLSCNELSDLIEFHQNSLQLGNNNMKITSIKHINLSWNRLRTITKDTFMRNQYFRTVNMLILSHNQISTIDLESFLNLENLQYLDLSYNRINGNSIHSLQGIPNLVSLSIAYNPDLSDSLQEFVASWSLKELDASGTGLCRIPAALALSIRTLKLANNWLSVIRCGDLDSYPLLQYLDLSSSHINEIEEDALGRLEVLEVLFLDRNRLKRVPVSLPTSLEHLFLQNNLITDIQPRIFQGLENLITLDLSGNVLIYVPALPLPKLITLNLQSSELKGLSQSVVKTSPKLKDLLLDGNPIKCSDLLGIAEWASPCQNDRIPEPKDIKSHFQRVYNHFESLHDDTYRHGKCLKDCSCDNNIPFSNNVDITTANSVTSSSQNSSNSENVTMTRTPSIHYVNNNSFAIKPTCADSNVKFIQSNKLESLLQGYEVKKNNNNNKTVGNMHGTDNRNTSNSRYNNSSNGNGKRKRVPYANLWHLSTPSVTTEQPTTLSFSQKINEKQKINPQRNGERETNISENSLKSFSNVLNGNAFRIASEYHFTTEIPRSTSNAPEYNLNINENKTIINFYSPSPNLTERAHQLSNLKDQNKNLSLSSTASTSSVPFQGNRIRKDENVAKIIDIFARNKEVDRFKTTPSELKLNNNYNEVLVSLSQVKFINHTQSYRDKTNNITAIPINRKEKFNGTFINEDNRNDGEQIIERKFKMNATNPFQENENNLSTPENVDFLPKQKEIISSTSNKDVTGIGKQHTDSFHKIDEGNISNFRVISREEINNNENGNKDINRTDILKKEFSINTTASNSNEEKDFKKNVDASAKIKKELKNLSTPATNESDGETIIEQQINYEPKQKTKKLRASARTSLQNYVTSVTSSPLTSLSQVQFSSISPKSIKLLKTRSYFETSEPSLTTLPLLPSTSPIISSSTKMSPTKLPKVYKIDFIDRTNHETRYPLHQDQTLSKDENRIIKRNHNGTASTLNEKLNVNYQHQFEGTSHFLEGSRSKIYSPMNSSNEKHLQSAATPIKLDETFKKHTLPEKRKMQKRLRLHDPITVSAPQQPDVNEQERNKKYKGNDDQKMEQNSSTPPSAARRLTVLSLNSSQLQSTALHNAKGNNINLKYGKSSKLSLDKHLVRKVKKFNETHSTFLVPSPMPVPLKIKQQLQEGQKLHNVNGEETQDKDELSYKFNHLESSQVEHILGKASSSIITHHYSPPPPHQPYNNAMEPSLSFWSSKFSLPSVQQQQQRQYTPEDSGKVESNSRDQSHFMGERTIFEKANVKHSHHTLNTPNYFEQNDQEHGPEFDSYDITGDDDSHKDTTADMKSASEELHQKHKSGSSNVHYTVNTPNNIPYTPNYMTSVYVNNLQSNTATTKIAQTKKDVQKQRKITSNEKSIKSNNFTNMMKQVFLNFNVSEKVSNTSQQNNNEKTFNNHNRNSTSSNNSTGNYQNSTSYEKHSNHTSSETTTSSTSLPPEQWTDIRTSGHPGLFIVIGITVGILLTLGLIHVYKCRKPWWYYSYYTRRRRHSAIHHNRHKLAAKHHHCLHNGENNHHYYHCHSDGHPDDIVSLHQNAGSHLNGSSPSYSGANSNYNCNCDEDNYYIEMDQESSQTSMRRDFLPMELLKSPIPAATVNYNSHSSLHRGKNATLSQEYYRSGRKQQGQQREQQQQHIGVNSSTERRSSSPSIWW